MFLGYVIAVAGVLFALLLLIVARLEPRIFSGVRGAALDATAPISAGGRSVVRFFTGGGETVGNYFAAASRNAELKQALARSRERLIEARAIEFENRRLKKLLNLTNSVSDEVVTARIVGSSFETSRRLATLSAGSSQGIEPGQPVRAPEGLIGRVLEAGHWASRVLLVTDAASNVPVQLVRNGTPALANGRGDGTIELKTLEAGESAFKRGDIVVTSGIGGIYPPLVPVAIVVQATRDTTIARPLANPSRIDYAIVERIYQPAANTPVNAAEAAQQDQPQ